MVMFLWDWVHADKSLPTQSDEYCEAKRVEGSWRAWKGWRVQVVRERSVESASRKRK